MLPKLHSLIALVVIPRDFRDELTSEQEGKAASAFLCSEIPVLHANPLTCSPPHCQLD